MKPDNGNVSPKTPQTFSDVLNAVGGPRGPGGMFVLYLDEAKRGIVEPMFGPTETGAADVRKPEKPKV